MTADEIADRVELARRLRAEANIHRKAARRYVAAANELVKIAGGGKAGNGSGVIVAEHFFGAVPQSQHHA